VTLSAIALLGASLASPTLPVQAAEDRSARSDVRARVSGMKDFLRLVKEAGYEPEFQEAYFAWLLQRASPFDAPDWRAYDDAIAIRSKMRAVGQGLKGSQGGNQIASGPMWIERGPRNLDTPTRLWHGPQRALSGRVNGLAVDYFNEQTFYLASAGGGVWKSTDAGSTWTPKSGTDWPYLQTTCVATDRRNPGRVYAGTGDSRGFFRLYGKGVYKSDNGGDTWSRNNNLDGSAVSEIAVDPDSSQVLVTTSGRADFTWQTGQVYLSNDGTTFNAQAAPGTMIWQGATIGAKNRDLKRDYYVAGYSLNVGATNGAVKVWKRDGVTGVWSDVTPPGLAAVTAANRNRAGVDVSASPGNPDNVYVVSGIDQKIFRSTTRGASWDDVTGAGAPWSDAYNWSQSSYNFHVTCSYVPGGARDVVYVGQITVGASASNGDAWIDLGRTYTPNAARTHNDQHCVAFAPSNPHLVYVGNDGGVYRVTHNPVNGTWGNVVTSTNANLNVTQFYHGATGTGSTEQMMGGTQDNATPRSYGAVSPMDGQAAVVNRWNNAGSGDGFFTAINPLDPNDSYVTIGGGLRRSTDGWAGLAVDANGNLVADTATQFALRFPNYGWDVAWARAMGAMDPDGTTLYYSCYAGQPNFFSLAYLFRYTGGAAAAGSRFDNVASGVAGNDGNLRFRLGPDAALYENSGFQFDASGGGTDNGWVSAVAVAPGDRNTVYVGTSRGRVFVTKNARASVINVVFTEITRNLPGRFVTDITVDTNDPNLVYLTLGGTGNTGDYVWKNADSRTANWTDIDNGLTPVSHNTLVRDTSGRLPVLWVGADTGVFQSIDDGATWQNATTPLGLPNVQVNELVLNSGTGRLTAFTFGRGAWDIETGAYPIVGFGLQDLTFRGARAGVEGRIVLSKPAAAAKTYNLWTDEPTVFTLPATVTVPAGQTSATFTVDVAAVAVGTVGLITADDGSDLFVFYVRADP
jgi:hypothetical protein